MKDFQNKTIVITGAGSGIGRALAVEFARLGSNLALNDYDQGGLAGTVKLCEKAGDGKVIHEVFDVSSEEKMNDFAARVAAEQEGAYVVVNNAGIEGGALPVYNLKTESYRRVMDINFFGVVFGTRSFLPQLIEKGEGAIVNISSVFGLIGMPSNSDYCAAKFAVAGFTESLMTELVDTPIKAHLVHPGGIATNIVRNEKGKDFARKFLTTPPEDLARRIISGLKGGELRIIYGNGSWKVRIGWKLLSLEARIKQGWQEFSKGIDPADYNYLDKFKK